LFHTETETIFVLMFTTLNRLALSLAFVLFGLSAFAQRDTLALDSITQRIRVIIQEYNDKVLFVDTSDYAIEGFGVDDFNLQIAASKGACNEIIRLYLKGADVDNIVGKTATPLHYAVAAGKKDAVEILLLLGAHTDVTDMYGNTPLTSAVRSNDLDMTEMLIRYGASLTKADRVNSTPLHHASALGFFYIADMLLYYEAPIELRDQEGNTPLMTAVSFGYHDIADILLQAGADPSGADRKGFTPLMAAAQNGDTLMIRLLINSGANLYAVNNDGIDALGCAAITGQKSVAGFLLDNGSRWTYSGREMSDPINLASHYGHRELVQIFTERGMAVERGSSLSELTLSAGGMITTHYQLADVSLSISNPKIRTGIKFGAAFNPASQRMLIAGDDDILYQYRLSSSVIYAGLFREYQLSNPGSGRTWSIVPSLSAGYRFHSLYEGTTDRPESKFCIIPATEIRWSRNNLSIGSGLTYINTPFYKVLPVWLTLRASYSLIRESQKNTVKKIRLYNYE
jgi:ankyrin repeat protein